MANRTWNNPRALEKELVNIVGQFGIGTDAALVAGSPLGRGISAITKISTGLYKVVLQDAYVALISAQVSALAANAATQAVDTQLGDYNVTSNASQTASIGKASANSIAAQSIYIRTVNSSGAVADASVAATIFLDLKLRNSEVV